MVDINTNASGLQSRLQAQLQGSRGSRPSTSGLDITPRPQDIIEDRIKARQSESDRQAPAQKSGRTNDLSSSRELEAAQGRVNELGNRREAPIGRLSAQATAQRDVPLGQIIDIKV